MPNYLKDSNHLLIWPVFKEVTENDLFICNIGVRARYDMTGEELLQACVDAWQLDKDKKYRLRLIRPDQQVDIPPDTVIKEIGIRNGDPLEIISC
ncbi:hypothetical protein [Thermoactinomyces mirandus]|uniref:Uncharacterized protein n=1 Tax=Thermoactinomyces mirandus TaxID=2756294 RepID=A0A7W2APX1_9BACL|nr:hypothetical protein [Thermoactinomyces mirandus]MBA4601399.1 hypothetical protein [Thermoactinomyces mirandus]